DGRTHQILHRQARVPQGPNGIDPHGDGFRRLQVQVPAEGEAPALLYLLFLVFQLDAEPPEVGSVGQHHREDGKERPRRHAPDHLGNGCEQCKDIQGSSPHSQACRSAAWPWKTSPSTGPLPLSVRPTAVSGYFGGPLSLSLRWGLRKARAA